MNNFVYVNKELTGKKTIITNLDNLSEAYGVQIDGVLEYDFLCKEPFVLISIRNN